MLYSGEMSCIIDGRGADTPSPPYILSLPNCLLIFIPSWGNKPTRRREAGDTTKQAFLTTSLPKINPTTIPLMFVEI